MALGLATDCGQLIALYVFFDDAAVEKAHGAVGVVASIIMPSESLWRRAAYEMQSPLVGALGFSPFSNASTPSLAMVGYAAVYLAMALAFAIRRFGQRDL